MKENENMNPKNGNSILVALMSCLMAALLYGCGGETEVTPTTNTEEVNLETHEDSGSSEQESPEVEEEQPKEEINNDRGGLPEHTYFSNDGRVYHDIGYEGHFAKEDTPEDEYCLVVIEDIGTTVVNYAADYMDYLVPYIDFDINNTSSTNIGFIDMNTSLYIDDYKVDEGLWMVSIGDYFPDIECGSVDVEPGRKAKFRAYATIPVEKAEAADRIEIEHAGVTVLFKEDGKWRYGDQVSSDSGSSITGDSSSVVYGVYTIDMNTYGGKSEAEIGFYTDEDYPGDYIYITLYDGEGNLCSDYSGYSPEGGNPTIFYDKYETGFQVTYTNNGIEVKGIEDGEYEEEFNGSYQLDHAFNFDEVG